MIDQNTVVHIGFGSQQTIILGTLALFEYTASIDNGQIKLSFVRRGSEFDKEEIGKLVSQTKKEIAITLITDKSEHSYKANLAEVNLISNEFLETLILKALVV